MDILGLLRRYYGFVTCGVLRLYRGLFYRRSGCLWLRSGLWVQEFGVWEFRQVDAGR